MEAHRSSSPESEAALQPEAETADIETAAQEAPGLAVSEGNLVAEALMRQPAVAFEHVSKAAEIDKPVEIAYETRHEIKDEPPVEQAVSIGSVLAGMQLGKIAATKSAAKNDQTSGHAKTPPTVDILRINHSGLTNTYKQAIKGGFFAALALLTLILLTKLLS